MKHSTDTLPNWAQNKIADLLRRIDELKTEVANVEKTNELTSNGRRWFTLGQANEYVSTLTTPANLYMPVGNELRAIANLAAGDCLLVSRGHFHPRITRKPPEGEEASE